MNPDVIARNLAAGEIVRPGAKQHTKRRRATKKTRRLRQASPERRELKRLWDFIKRSMIEAQIRTNGYTSCMECGERNPRHMELDHIEPAGRGGPWTPENAQLLCSGPGSCHDRKHGAPRFSGSQL